MEMNKYLNLGQDLNKIIGKRLRELRPIIASEEIEIMHLSSAALIINPPQLWSVHFNAFYNPVKFFSIAHCAPKMDLCSELHCVVALVALMWLYSGSIVALICLSLTQLTFANQLVVTKASSRKQVLYVGPVTSPQLWRCVALGLLSIY